LGWGSSQDPASSGVVVDQPSVQDLQGSLLGRRAAHLPSGDHSWQPAVANIQCPASVLEEAGAGTGHSEEQAQGARPAYVLMEARARHYGRLVQWVVVGEPEIQAA